MAIAVSSSAQAAQPDHRQQQRGGQHAGEAGEETAGGHIGAAWPTSASPAGRLAVACGEEGVGVIGRLRVAALGRLIPQRGEACRFIGGDRHSRLS